MREGSLDAPIDPAVLESFERAAAGYRARMLFSFGFGRTSRGRHRGKRRTLHDWWASSPVGQWLVDR